jgi:hypothetical protein
MRRTKTKIQRELNPNEIEIQFIDVLYAGKFGVRPIIVHKDAALRYVEKGVAKILRDQPSHNPVPILEPVKEEPIEPEKEEVVASDVPSCIDQMVHNPYALHITWIGAHDFLNKVRKSAEDVGFIITDMNPSKLHTTSALCADLLVVSSDLSEFDEYQRVSINVILFQKRIPFLLVANDFNEAIDVRRITNSVFQARSIIFHDQNIFDKWTDVFGDIMKQWIAFKTPHLFWKGVGDCIGRKNG